MMFYKKKSIDLVVRDEKKASICEHFQFVRVRGSHTHLNLKRENSAKF